MTIKASQKDEIIAVAQSLNHLMQNIGTLTNKCLFAVIIQKFY